MPLIDVQARARGMLQHAGQHTAIASASEESDGEHRLLLPLLQLLALGRALHECHARQPPAVQRPTLACRFAAACRCRRIAAGLGVRG